jgi:hypothetical protein
MGHAWALSTFHMSKVCQRSLDILGNDIISGQCSIPGRPYAACLQELDQIGKFRKWGNAFILFLENVVLHQRNRQTTWRTDTRTHKQLKRGPDVEIQVSLACLWGRTLHSGRRPRLYKQKLTSSAESINKWLIWWVSWIQSVNPAWKPPLFGSHLLVRRFAGYRAIHCKPG